MPDQRNIVGTGDHYKQIKQLFPGYETQTNTGYTHKDQYFDNENIDKFGFKLTQPQMLGTTAYEVPAQAALDSLYSADYLKKYTPKVEEVNDRRAKLNTNLAPISPYFNVLLPDTKIQYDDDLTPSRSNSLISMNSPAYFPFTQTLNFGLHEAAEEGPHTKFLDGRYSRPQKSGRWAKQNGFGPVRPDFSKEYTHPQQASKSLKNHELGHLVNYPDAGEGVFDLTKNNSPSSFYPKYYTTPEGHTYGKYMLFPELDTYSAMNRSHPDDPIYLYHSSSTYNQVPGEFYNFLGQVKRWGPKFGFDGTMDTSDMTKHRQAMMDTVNHIMNLKPEDIDDIELLRAHNYLNTAKQNYPRNMSNQNKIRDIAKEHAEDKYYQQARDEYRIKEKAIFGDMPESPFDISEQAYNTINQILANNGQQSLDTWIPHRAYKAISNDIKALPPDLPELNLKMSESTPEMIAEAMHPVLNGKYSKEDLTKYLKFFYNLEDLDDGLREERGNRKLELMEKDPKNYYKNIQDLDQHNPEEVIPSMILDQVSDDDLRALVNNRQSTSTNRGSLQRLMYS